MISPQEALERLREGNRRFAGVAESRRAGCDQARRVALVVGQSPWAIVLGCSDSRVPVETVFDCGLGDLFVVRVAGNVAGPSQVGSIELAVVRFGTRLVVVLGHSHCGAIKVALEDIERPDSAMSADLHSVVDLVRPSVERLVAPGSAYDRDAILAQAVRSNVVAAVYRLRHGSDVLRCRARDAGLVIVGAEYSLETGVVDFFDGGPGVGREKG